MALNDKLINYEDISTFHSNLLNDSSISVKATWTSSKISSEISGIDSSLAAKADVSYVDSSLALKADKSYVDSSLALKQDVISDLSTIRSGAALGSTALQSVPSEYVTENELDASLASYATNASLATKQDILTAGTNIEISGTTISATYQTASTAEIEALFA